MSPCFPFLWDEQPPSLKLSFPHSPPNGPRQPLPLPLISWCETLAKASSQPLMPPHVSSLLPTSLSSSTRSGATYGAPQVLISSPNSPTPQPRGWWRWLSKAFQFGYCLFSEDGYWSVALQLEELEEWNAAFQHQALHKDRLLFSKDL